MNTHGRKLEIFAQRDQWSRQIGFWMRKTSWTPDRTEQAYAQPVVFRAMTDADEGIVQPFAFSMGDDDAQRLMDELWRCGFRPTEGSGSAGSLAATERHLEDMRALVFKKQPK